MNSTRGSVQELDSGLREVTIILLLGVHKSCRAQILPSAPENLPCALVSPNQVLDESMPTDAIRAGDEGYVSG